MTYLNKSFISGFFFASFLMGAALLPLRSVHAIALTPPTVNVPTILRDTVQYKTLYISRAGDEFGDITVRVVAREGSEDYLELPTEEFVIPANERVYAYKIGITPGSAANGDYAAYVNFLKDPSSDATDGVQSAGASIITGVTAAIDFTVSGEEIVDYSLSNFEIADAEVDQTIYGSYLVSNRGNVAWKPDSIELTFTNIDDPRDITTATISEDELETTQPGDESSKVLYSVTPKLKEGTYTVTAVFTYDDEKTSLEVANFNLYPVGTLAQEGEILSISTNKSVFELGEKIKLDVVFANTGEVPVKGLLITEIYKDEEFLDLVRGDEVLVEKRRQSTFSGVMELNEPGDYSFKSYVEYGFKKTETKDVSVTIAGGFFSKPLNSFLVLFGFSVVLLGCALVYRSHKLKQQ